MLYDRKIKYLDYSENGERVRGGGFVKLEVRDGSMRMEVKVTGLHPTDSFDREILLRDGKKEKALGSMAIAGGKGQYLQLCRDLNNIGGTGISYGELLGIRIPLGAGREISCVLQTPHAAGQQESAGEAMSSKGRREEKRNKAPGRNGREIFHTEEAESGFGRSSRTNSLDTTGESRTGGGRAEESGGSGQGIREERTYSRGAEESGGSGQRIGEDGMYSQRTEESEGSGQRIGEDGMYSRRTEESGGSGQRIGEDGMYSRMTEQADVQGAMMEQKRIRQEDEKGRRKQQPEKPVPQLEDKWAQLWSIYPHIQPFQDEREYLSIRPSDFVLFPSESYKMVNNSFLLHGYYNYHHLLLGRVERRGEIFYYIGVPGNFFEREKQVAIMFGFESFECAEEPAQAGDFGYYMMRTQL